jgi:AcrR family transcriptional regulator
MKIANPERRERIIRAAAHLFGERHFHQVLVDDVAARAGVSKGTVYCYFKDKDDLYLALILDGMQALFEKAQQKIAAPGTPEDKLLGLIENMFEFCDDAPYFLELIQRADLYQLASHSVTALQQSKARFRSLLIEIIKELKGSQPWEAADPELAATCLMGTVREVLRMRKPTDVGLPKRIVHLFLNGIRGEAGTLSHSNLDSPLKISGC